MSFTNEHDNKPDHSTLEENQNSSSNDVESNEIESLRRELEHAKERASYLAADFDNFRRRADKERLQSLITSQATILNDILPIVDDFDRAFHELEQKPELASYFSGFELIYKALQKMLQKNGVTEVATTGEFNPELHEGIMHVTDPSKPSGHIAQVFQKGYLLKGNLLRPAKVSVTS